MISALALAASVALLGMPGAAAIEPSEPPKAASSRPMPYGQGVLWKIERAGVKPSYLFGTIHLSYEEIVKLPKPVKQAFDRAQSASFEIEMDRKSWRRWALASYYYNWKTLDADIGPDLYANVIELAEPYGLTIHQMRKVKPWVVLLMLSAPPGVYTDRKAGDKILDQWLHDEALEQGKKVYGLETIEEHVGVFADLPQDVLRKVIRAMVQQDRVRLRTELSTMHEEMVQLYLKRDIEGILKLGHGLSSGVGDEIEQMIEDRLLAQRNHLMVKRMQPRLEEGNAFVAVGAGHLPGEEGMVNLLVQQGYKVTRLY
ncbi:MAG: TraB/GumN family protein [Kiloniellales bacterium]